MNENQKEELRAWQNQAYTAQPGDFLSCHSCAIGYVLTTSVKINIDKYLQIH